MVRRRLDDSRAPLAWQLPLVAALGTALAAAMIGLVLLKGPVQDAGTWSSASGASTATWNAADVTYVQAMLWHQDQAREMARLVLGRATRPELRRLSRSMRAAQSNDVAHLTAWLRAHGHGDFSDGPDHRPTAPADRWFAGMMAPPQLRTLASTTGQRFDFLFVDMLIEHHRGVIVMADEVLADGRDAEITLFAKRAKTYAHRELRQLTAWRQRWAEPFLRQLTPRTAQPMPASS
jgi:uncharacterized protein (DUF305 family)